MVGNIWNVIFLLHVLLYLVSAWQTPNTEYLKSLPGKYDDLLKDLACKDLSSPTKLENCELFMLTDQNEVLTDEELAWEWFNIVDEILVNESYEGAIALWNYETNMTDYNQQVKANVSLLNAIWGTKMKKQGRRFDYKQFTDERLKRLFRFMLRGGNLGLDSVSTQMIDIYGKGRVCRPTGQKYTLKGLQYPSNMSKGNFLNKNTKQECLALEPELQDIMATSRDYDELLWVWQGWRDAVGRKIRPLYQVWVELKNSVSRNGGYADEGELWRELYEIKDDGLEEIVDDLYQKVRPLYKQLHAFVRRRLAEKYPGKVKTNGYIPAHLLGNMWAQQWNNIYDIAKPYPDVDEVDVTVEMKRQNYNQTYMFKVAERFFMSIGMDPMPENFWKYSMIEKPDDREVVCHGSAHNFMKNREVRIKMCTEVDMEDLYTIHHEMGHCEYYLQYSDQEVLFRSGANPGFHEAVGDTIALSVVTPDYLHTIGLMDTIERSKEDTINYQMKIALSKIAFLPFGLMIDKWRWEVFRENIKPEEYNDKWWEYRRKYQGIDAPIPRSEGDFDPGAKYHIPSGTPYIRYFVSFLIQFQFQRALCKEAGFSGPLHQCNTYQSTKAGEKLKEMLKLGKSQPWRESLKVLTGQTTIDPTAIQEYFAPLIEWLEEQNKYEKLGWEEEDDDNNNDNDD